MSKKDLLRVLADVLRWGGVVEEDRTQVRVIFATSYEADVLTGCLIHLRNIEAVALGNRVLIPIDETGRTIRAHQHEPEPRP